MQDVFQLEPTTQIDRAQSYIRAYPHILAALQSRKELDEQDFVCAAHMVYGWMPTILEIHASESLDVRQGAALLNKARAEGCLSEVEIGQLAQLVNRSVVGASKLLHFVNPKEFAIWDSRIYRFMHLKEPHQYRVNNVAEYGRYLGRLRELRKDGRFGGLHESVNGKMGYAVSGVRALEVVMFVNGVGR
ncbi:hypothetical protein [Pseudomonas alloputida]|uniref:hypothetical protein n=1 Tax=Pseudomonas TaxID=286 RepID=UPI003EEE0770